MPQKTILYFDKVFEEFKQLLLEHKPPGFDLWYWDEMTEQERTEMLPQSDYLLVATRKVGKDILSQAHRARFVQKTGIGVDNIDLEEAARLGLPVCNTPGGNSTGVAELTVLLILSLYRKLPLLNESLKSGRWLSWEVRLNSYQMEGKTHGFIGFGNIGRETAKRSRAFGTKIVYHDKFRLPEEKERELGAIYLELEELLETADIVSIHAPLLPETRNLIGEKELKLMKPNAILINVSRGGIVEEAALCHALKQEWIAGAGIDVWQSEPPDKEHPLLTLANVVATPHIGAGTRDTLDQVLHMAFQNIKKADEGQTPDYAVNGVDKVRANFSIT